MQSAIQTYSSVSKRFIQPIDLHQKRGQRSPPGLGWATVTEPEPSVPAMNIWWEASSWHGDHHSFTLAALSGEETADRQPSCFPLMKFSSVPSEHDKWQFRWAILRASSQSKRALLNWSVIYALRFVVAVGIQQSRLNTPYAFCDVDAVEVAGRDTRMKTRSTMPLDRPWCLFMSYTGGCYLWANILLREWSKSHCTPEEKEHYTEMRRMKSRIIQPVRVNQVILYSIQGKTWVLRRNYQDRINI